MPYASDPTPVEGRFADAPVAYPEAVAAMEERVAAIRAGAAPELVWLLEHPPLYTAGTSARPEELLDQGRVPVHPNRRGRQHTHDGPAPPVRSGMRDLE